MNEDWTKEPLGPGCKGFSNDCRCDICTDIERAALEPTDSDLAPHRQDLLDNKNIKVKNGRFTVE